MKIFFANNRKWSIDRNLLFLLAGFYALYDVIYVVKTAYMNAFGFDKMKISWIDFFINHIFLDYLLVVSFMTIIAISTKRLLRKKYSWLKIISLHIIFSLLIGIFIRVFFDIYLLVIGNYTLSQYDFKLSLYRFMYVLDLNFLIYFAMIFIVYTYYYVKEVKKSENKQGKLKAQLVNARMRMLSSQLQPHFLFNTLNSIAVLTDIDAGKAKDTIADLSDFLREILYDNDSNTIPLEKELHVLGFYLNILNVRFSDHLRITINVDERLLSKKVPSLIIQPILENSIKHGFDYDHAQLTIHVNIFSEENWLVFTIENNGASLSSNSNMIFKRGLGLSNIRDRLKNLYNNAYLYELRNKQNQKGVETVIKIPLED